MIRYEGWIAQDGVDVSWLQELGVGGRMHSQLYVSHCEVPNEETVKRLIAELPGCWSASFTAIDENGKQLPIEQQRYWTLGPALAHVREEMKERKRNPPAPETKKGTWREFWRAFFSKDYWRPLP